MGMVFDGAELSASGKYKLTGITEVGDKIPFDEIFDRGWPDYNFPVDISQTDNIKNYRQFLTWQENKNGVRVKRFLAGRNDQLVLMHNSEKYPDFVIQNLAVNGHVWTGTNMNERNQFPAISDLPPDEYPNENMCSCAFRLSYGNFDYYTGGDLIYATPFRWQNIEEAVGLVTGPVDVCVVNHHAFYDAMGDPFISALRPRVFVMQTFVASQPSNSAMSRIFSTYNYPGPRDVFATNIMDANRIVNGPKMDKLKSQQGHIVIRVAPGGDSYMIYILDDTTENFTVKGIFGPYTCR
jgi:hypothetical protein